MKCAMSVITRMAIGATVALSACTDSGLPVHDAEPRSTLTRVWTGTVQVPGNAIDNKVRLEICGAGDFDGDGVEDIMLVAEEFGAISCCHLPTWGGGVCIVLSGRDRNVLYNSENDLNRSEAHVLSAISIGDVNADGTDELAIATIVGSWDAGRVSRVDIQGWNRARSVTVYSVRPPSDRGYLLDHEGILAFGSSMALLGDIDGDGVKDFAVCSPEIWDPESPRGHTDPRGNGIVEAFSGSSGALVWKRSRVAYDHGFASAIGRIGDVNGDGFDDVVVGSPPSASASLSLDVTGYVYVLCGRTGATVCVWGGGTDYERFGQSLMGVGDVDSDGIDDVVVGFAGSGRLPGAFRVHSSQAGAGLAPVSRTEDNMSCTFWTVRAAGDLDGDGVGELVFYDAMGGDRRWRESVCVDGVYVLSARTGAPIPGLEVNRLGFGWGTAAGCVGDIDGDGRVDLGVVDGVWVDADSATSSNTRIQVGVYSLASR
ncbi:MAG: integrin alpha [Planctomycetota bacterium]